MREEGKEGNMQEVKSLFVILDSLPFPENRTTQNNNNERFLSTLNIKQLQTHLLAHYLIIHQTKRRWTTSRASIKRLSWNELNYSQKEVRKKWHAMTDNWWHISNTRLWHWCHVIIPPVTNQRQSQQTNHSQWRNLRRAVRQIMLIRR